jgi:hypothetical protein
MADTYKIGIFDDEDKFISSVRLLTEQDFKIFEVFTPYPVHEVLHLLKRRSKLPTAAYFFGLFGMVATLAFLYWAAVVDWPVVYGGKPVNSFPSFIIITIVITILIVTIGSLAVFSARSKLFPGRDNTIFDRRATDDKFVIVVAFDSPAGSIAKKAGIIMKEQGATEIQDKEFEKVST